MDGKYSIFLRFFHYFAVTYCNNNPVSICTVFKIVNINEINRMLWLKFLLR